MASTGTTIQTEIERIKKAKSDIKTAIINKGGTISDTATIDKYAAAIDGLSVGGKKLKINVVTINPERLYNGLYFIPYGDSALNIVHVYDEDNSIGTDGVFVSTFETETFDGKFTISFESLKGIPLPDDSVLCSIYTKREENAIGEKQWSNFYDYKQLEINNQWCKEANYEMTGNGSVEYTIVFNINKVEYISNSFPAVFNYTIIRDDTTFSQKETFMLPSSHTFIDGVVLSVDDANSARILGYHVDYMKGYYPYYYFTIVTDSTTKDVIVNITDKYLSSYKGISYSIGHNAFAGTTDKNSYASPTVNYTNKTITLKCHLYVTDIFKGSFMIGDKGSTGGAEN